MVKVWVSELVYHASLRNLITSIPEWDINFYPSKGFYAIEESLDLGASGLISRETAHFYDTDV